MMDNTERKLHGRAGAGSGVDGCDVSLGGGMDGIETACLMRELALRVPITFVTRYGDPDTAERIRALSTRCDRSD